MKHLTLEGKRKGGREREREKKKMEGKREDQSQLLHSLVSLYAHLDLITGSDLGGVQ